MNELDPELSDAFLKRALADETAIGLLSEEEQLLLQQGDYYFKALWDSALDTVDDPFEMILPLKNK